jgi:hypothetical protein
MDSFHASNPKFDFILSRQYFKNNPHTHEEKEKIYINLPLKKRKNKNES